MRGCPRRRATSTASRPSSPSRKSAFSCVGTPRPALDPTPPEVDRGVETSKSFPSNEPEKSVNDDPLIWFPGAKKSDHNESKDNKDDHTMRGESPELRGYLPGGSDGFGRTKGP